MRSLVLCCSLTAACVSEPPVEVSTSALDGTIQVTAYHWASEIPFAGADVQFIAPDQSVQTVVTDANGFAEAVSPPNTRVVVFQDGELTGTPVVRVFDAANPGDHIIAGLRHSEAGADLGTIRFTLPSRDGWNHKHDVIYYRLNVSCSPDNGISLDSSRDMRVSNCPHATNATAVGWIEDSAGVVLTGPSVLRNIDLTANSGKAIHMPAYESKLTSVNGQFLNTPSDEQLEWGTAWLYGDDPTIFGFDQTFEPARDVVNTRPAPEIGDRTLSSLRLLSPFGDTNVFNLRVESGFVHDYVVDVSQRIPHDSRPTFSPYSQTIFWNPSPGGQPSEMVYAYLIVFAPARGFYRIEVYAPGNRTSVTLPALPAAVTPQQTDSVFVFANHYRISNETYSQWLQVHSTRDPINSYTWSSPLPRDVWIGF